MNARVRVSVTGVVQGVGFRYFTRRSAATLGLTGWVRNLNDGSVELVAEGPRDALERLLALLTQGPSGSVVREVKAEWSEASDEFADFGVRV